MKPNSQTNRIRSFTISLVGRFLALLILSSFAVTLLPLANASANSMPCCAGKADGHCDSGLAAPKPALPPDEPMCGLKTSQSLTAEALDAVTVVAEHAHHADSHESEGNAFKTASVSKQCHMDCGACATSTSRHKRQKGVVPAKTTNAPAQTTIARVENHAPFFSSIEVWTRISPRGPPARG